MSNYQDPETAQKYLEFLNSKNGQIQKSILWEAIKSRLPKNSQAQILDAASGDGWLTKHLADIFPAAQGCDSSEPLIKLAKKEHRGIRFEIADLLQPLPYPADFFDVIIVNMAAPDILDLAKMFKNIFAALKPAAPLILTLPNPYYTFPVGVWKRSFWDFILRRKPRLCIHENYNRAENITREFGGKDTKIASNFYPLAEYITRARSAGLTLVDVEELRSKIDSREFDLNYQLYRFPLILLLEFAKPGI